MKLSKIFLPLSNAINKLPCRVVFFVSLLCFLPFLQQKNIYALSLETLLFFCLALLKRKKILVLPSVILLFFLVFFEILSPQGKVLFQKGFVIITQDALQQGIKKTCHLCGLVFLSQFAVSKDLRFPGRFGNFIAKVFSIFALLSMQEQKDKSLKQKKHFCIKDFIHIVYLIDDKLLKTYNITKLQR